MDVTKEALYRLSSEQKTAIEKGQKEIKEGNFYTNDEVISEMREWLKEII
jgi:predicted transcriptional regulator